MKHLLAGLALLLGSGAAMAAGTHAGGHDDMAIGRPGDVASATRTVELLMVETDDGDMKFEPEVLEFAEGETVRLIVVNTGEFEHEIVIDSSDKITEHKALMEEFPEMEHDDPNAIRLDPGQSGEIVWTFTTAGRFEFACLIPGHYELGMHGPVVVAAKS
jgi:uncharacterized cupredoxin-like copper-binding protein